MVIQKALHRVRPSFGVLPKFIAICLASDASSGILERYFTGSTIKHFTGESLHSYVFPLPSLVEQNRITTDVERIFSHIDEMQFIINNADKQSNRLHQSILKQAFSGKLILQDAQKELIDFPTQKGSLNQLSFGL